MQKGASAAVRSGIASADLQKLAAIGSHGLYVSRCNHDLMQKFSLHDSDAPPVNIVKVPVVDKEDKVIWVDCAVLFPHRVFAHYSAGSQAVFEAKHILFVFCSSLFLELLVAIFGCADQIREWWAGQDLGDPKLYHHPLLGQPNYQSNICFVVFLLCYITSCN